MSHNESDWVVIGRFGRPHGIKGMISIVSFTEPKDNIVSYLNWNVRLKKHWQPITLLRTEVRDRMILAEVEGYSSREQVALLTNCDIAIKNEQLATLSLGEYYWHQLIGLQVVTVQGQPLGEVKEILATGSNDVLVVEGPTRHLIPYLPDDVVIEVNTLQRLITVDWDVDF